MSGSVVGKVLPFGYPGTVSRTPDCVIESKPVKYNSANIEFGKPVVLNADNTFSSPTSESLTATNFAGVAVAEVKQQLSYSVGQDVNQAGYYAAEQPCDVIQRGIVAVKVAYGTPTAGGAVYVRTVLNGSFPNEVVGDFRTAPDSTNTVQLTNCSWNSNMIDSNGVAELKIKYINN